MNETGSTHAASVTSTGVHPPAVYLPAVDRTVTLDTADLELVAAAISARLDDPGAEEARIEIVLEVQRTARELGRLFQHWVGQATIECRGSRSAWDLGTTNRLYIEALADYARTTRWAAGELRRVMAAGG